MIWPALAWLVMRLAVCTLAPNTSRVSSTTGPKWQPMRIDDRLALDPQLGVRGDLLLHLSGRVQRIIRARKGGHDLIADGLDHGAVVLLGGLAHHIDAGGDHVARAQVAHGFEQARRADHVGKQDRKLDVFAHAFLMLADRAVSEVAQSST